MRVKPLIVGLPLVIAGFFAASAATATATPRRVAVLNAAADQPTGAALAERLREALAAAAALEPLPGGELARALEQPLDDPGASAALAAARDAVALAAAAYVDFQYDEGLAQVARAERALLSLAPTPEVTALLAEANFQAALNYLGRGQEARALEALRACRRLDPSRVELDRARYLPEVVTAFDAAAIALDPSGRLDVTAAYDGAAVQVNGADAGATPLRLALPPGVHYVWGTFPEHRVAGHRLEIAVGQDVAVRLRLEPLAADERARELRRELSAAAGDAPPAGIAAAARTVALLTGVDAVIVVGTVDGALALAIYDGRTDRLTDWREVADVPPPRLVAPLLPQRTPELPPEQPPGPPVGPPDDRTRWHERGWVQASISGTVALAVVGILVFALSDSEPKEVIGSYGGFRR
jgi:hypothetical protein